MFSLFDLTHTTGLEERYTYVRRQVYLLTNYFGLGRQQPGRETARSRGRFPGLLRHHQLVRPFTMHAPQRATGGNMHRRIFL